MGPIGGASKSNLAVFWSLKYGPLARLAYAMGIQGFQILFQVNLLEHECIECIAGLMDLR